MNILELVVFVIFIGLFFTLLYINVYMRFKIRRLEADVVQGFVDLMEMSKKLEEAFKSTDEQKIEQTEGFLKFVSESRDWAFQYIERVQVAIKNFQDVFHPIATQYYKDREQPINQEEFGKLFEAYKKLVEELPEEGKND